MLPLITWNQAHYVIQLKGFENGVVVKKTAVGFVNTDLFKSDYLIKLVILYSAPEINKL